MKTTALTLAGGRTIEVVGDYESIDAYFATRAMTADDGRRKITTTCGRQATIHKDAVLLIEQTESTRKHAIGFR